MTPFTVDKMFSTKFIRHPPHHIMSKPTFWLRCEKKEFERRAALTPTTSKKLIEAGFEIFVERDEQRIFDDTEYDASVSPSMNYIFMHADTSAVLDASLSITIPGHQLPRISPSSA
jgi:hypothetical protein